MLQGFTVLTALRFLGKDTKLWILARADLFHSRKVGGSEEFLCRCYRRNKIYKNRREK